MLCLAEMYKLGLGQFEERRDTGGWAQGRNWDTNLASGFGYWGSWSGGMCMPYICDSTAPILPFESPLWTKGQREHKALGSHSEYSQF